MPTRLYDYDAAEVLHAKGLPIKEIARQTGIKYDALQKYAQRQGWTEKRTKAVQLVCASVQEQLIEHSRRHLLSMSDLASRAISVLQSKPLETLPLDDLQTLATVANTFDQVARRTYGLDAQNASAPKVMVNVQVAKQLGGSISLGDGSAFGLAEPVYDAELVEPTSEADAGSGASGAADPGSGAAQAGEPGKAG